MVGPGLCAATRERGGSEAERAESAASGAHIAGTSVHVINPRAPRGAERRDVARSVPPPAQRAGARPLAANQRRVGRGRGIPARPNPGGGAPSLRLPQGVGRGRASHSPGGTLQGWAEVGAGAAGSELGGGRAHPMPLALEVWHCQIGSINPPPFRGSQGLEGEHPAPRSLVRPLRKESASACPRRGSTRWEQVDQRPEHIG